MPQVSISMPDAQHITDVEKRFAAGNKTLSANEIAQALAAAANAVRHLCEVIEPWTPGKSGNQVMAGSGWMVSYKTDSESDEPETALVDKSTGTYYMLAGDHRDAYLAARDEGLPGLLRVFHGLEADHRFDA